ncbi:hypothetical protein [Gynuella sp.]|uniref:hypothetical protein n=1 Tax=Gynuella sp. TaxID=2969146 RepID=UPI003D0B9903
MSDKHHRAQLVPDHEQRAVRARYGRDQSIPDQDCSTRFLLIEGERVINTGNTLWGIANMKAKYS